MKTRTGFVANSSSSSFIVAFPRIPESVEDIKELLFPNQDILPNPYKYGADDITGWLTIDAAQIVYREIQDQEPNNSDKLREAFRNFFDEEISEYWDKAWQLKDEDEKNRAYEMIEKRSNEKAERMRQEFLMQNNGKYVYYIELSDNNGLLESALEHGDTFENFPHIKVSNH